MFDLLIRGERVVTPQGVGPREIAVQDGVIAALGAPGTLDKAQAARVIDAGPAVVMPGGNSRIRMLRNQISAPSDSRQR